MESTVAGTSVEMLCEHFETVRFLEHEAELLDDNRLEEWLECLHPDIRYVMPIRRTVTRKRLAESVSYDYSHFDETYDSLAIRVRRTMLPSAWVEDPPSRTRRFVTNVRVSTSPERDAFNVRSNLLVLRNRWDEPTYEIISAERHDVLAREPGIARLRERRIIVDQATLGITNLGIFL